ncbi:MFS transporter superfamily protein [Abortiporus biennis]
MTSESVEMNSMATTAKEQQKLTETVKMSNTDFSAMIEAPTTLEHLQQPKPMGFGFWMILISLCLANFCTALEMTCIFTALPAITQAVGGEDFAWVNSAYALASTALIPAGGGLADIFGRRGIIFTSYVLFALGSALCGSAQNMTWLIAGRSIQGAGSGGISALSWIILSDLVPLTERGKYNAMLGLTWATAMTLGPLIAGGFVSSGHWRWVFYINLPLTGISAPFLIIFLKLKSPKQTLREKLLRIDWIGIGLIVASSASVVLGLTWGGIKFGWSSFHVLVPLILGLVGLGVFAMYEFYLATEPIMPITVLSNRTSISGYFQTFLNTLVLIMWSFSFPVYFQACFGSSAVRSGVLVLPTGAVTGISLVLGGVSVAITKKYRPQLFIGWAITVLGCGVCSTIKFDTATRTATGLPTLIGIGCGCLLTTTVFSVLAPLPISENAHAVSLFAFFRSFSGVWAIAISSAVLDNQLSSRLPGDVLSLFPEGAAGVFFSIPIINGIPEPTRTVVRIAVAESLQVIWQVLIGISSMGFLACFLVKGVPLHTQVDKKWGLEDRERQTSPDVFVKEVS